MSRLTARSDTGMSNGYDILHVYVVFYALSDYGTEKLISDYFLVTWSRDQLLQKAY